jgi:hypothetical protein
MDEQLLRRFERGLVLPRMNAVDRADIDTGRVLRADARFGDDIRHAALLRGRAAGRPRTELRARPRVAPRPARKYNGGSRVEAHGRCRGDAVARCAAASAQLPPSGAWQEAAGYLRLFAPFGTRAGAYRIFVTTLPIDRLLGRLADDPSLLRPPGAWVPAPVVPSDAFGQTGQLRPFQARTTLRCASSGCRPRTPWRRRPSSRSVDPGFAVSESRADAIGVRYDADCRGPPMAALRRSATRFTRHV